MPTTVPARSRKLIFFRWLRYLLTGVLSLLIALVCAGAIYEAIESHRDRLRFHPPGQMVDIGGYRLHLYCTGEGSPAVILEAGGGNPWLSWYKVQPQAAQFTRVCSYDRAGLGWSDPSPKSRTTKVIAEELHTLLHNAGIAGPFVLVGHSLGGMGWMCECSPANIPLQWLGWCWWTLRIPIRTIVSRPRPRNSLRPLSM
jgi:Alpha/beta hydrolase family